MKYIDIVNELKSQSHSFRVCPETSSAIIEIVSRQQNSQERQLDQSKIDRFIRVLSDKYQSCQRKFVIEFILGF